MRLGRLLLLVVQALLGSYLYEAERPKSRARASASATQWQGTSRGHAS